MEERKLNYYQPLLSVRRGAQPKVNPKKTNDSKPSLPPLPFYKSDLKSGPVRNPGVVPFQWEQMPGQPKDENKIPKDGIWQRDVAPKLPPGRIVNHKQKSIDATPKESPISNSRSPTGNKGLSELENTEDDPQEKEVPSSSDDDNVTFVDARDTLSRTESFFNCSVSGVSGLDNQSTEGSGIFADPQTRDFMMGRFLPAAKAVASETPQFVPRKHSAAKKQPKPIQRVIKWKQQSPVSPQYSWPQHVHEKEEEGEKDEEESVGMEDMSAKLCGLLPKFCLLNPIPGMRGHAEVSSVRSVRTRPAYTESYSKSEKKDRTVNHRGDMKRAPHQYTSKNEPSINKRFGIQSIATVKSGSPHLFLDKGKRFLPHPQECRDLSASKHGIMNQSAAKFDEVISLQDAQETNPAIEKTLYVDSEPVEQSRNSISSSSESRGRNPSVDSLQDIKYITNGDEKQVNHPKSAETADSSSVVSTPEKSFKDVGEDLPKDEDSSQDVKECIHDNKLLDLGPILPKSPSESWLSRTLPSMPTKNQSSKPYLSNLAFRSSPVDHKREMRFRTTHLQHMVFRPVGELGPILEN